MGATAQGFANYEMQPVADALHDAAAAAADHAAKFKRALGAIFSFFSNTAIAVTRWLRGRCRFPLRRR
jgi:hypothetical protein